MFPFDPGVAQQMSQMAFGAYTPDPAAVGFGAPGLGHLGGIYQDADDVVVAYRGSVVPRGTHSLQELLVAGDDWLNVNFRFEQEAALGGMVHAGFLGRSNRTWDDVLGWVRANLRGRRLWVTGHSMGGALAILAGQRFVDAGIRPAGVYAFGAPMVGDERFRDNYGADLFCVENKHDIFPHLPFDGRLLRLIPTDLARGLARFVSGGNGYASVGEVRWITPEEELVEYDGNWIVRGVRFARLVANIPRWIRDHWIEEHVAHLGRY